MLSSHIMIQTSSMVLNITKTCRQLAASHAWPVSAMHRPPHALALATCGMTSQ